MIDAGRCPVCQARFRGSRACSRCGADLTRLMLLAAVSWRLREQARQAISLGDLPSALELVRQSLELQRTPSGDAIGTLCELLRAAPTRAS